MEYTEVLDRLSLFFVELEKKAAAGRVAFAEVEDNKADLARFDN